MKVVLVGYGRMGREIELQAGALGHQIAAVFDIDRPLKPESSLEGGEVIIDFSHADTVFHNLTEAARRGIPVVEGTTGWYDQLDRLYKIPELRVVYSPNFSIGMYQFTKIVERAGDLFGPLSEFDCYVHEWHHSGKADSPSGTARRLAEILLERLPGKQTVLAESCHRVIRAEELHVTSTRAGRFPGTHEVGFDSASDRIELRHIAHGRGGFALGALRAAEWIGNKSGIFTMDQFMTSLSKRI